MEKCLDDDLWMAGESKEGESNTGVCKMRSSFSSFYNL